MAQKLPRLLSVRQASELTGLSKNQLWSALRRGRITEKYAQLVDGRWVLRADFKILKSGMNKDPMLASLPDEFVSDEPPKDWEADLPALVQSGNPNPVGDTRRLVLPGFDKATEDYGVWELHALTGVHPVTQRRARQGKKVHAKVAVRLARGLGIPVERLLSER